MLWVLIRSASVRYFSWKNKKNINIIYVLTLNIALRKHAYSNILKILQPKNENCQIKESDIFRISAQNIDYGYLLELPQ